MAGGIQVVGTSGKDLREITKPALGAGDGYPAWSPNSKEIAFVRSNPSDLSVSIMVASADGKDVKRLTKVEQAVGVVRPAWTPDGSAIVYADTTGISEVPATGGTPKTILSGAYDEPAVAPK